MQEFEIRAELFAPPDVVWNRLADHRGWVDWAGVKEVVLRQEGDPAPNGLGAIRVIRTSGLALEEEITGFEPPKRMTYRLVAGIPIRDHVGEIELEPTDGGTELVWRVRFAPRVPGTGGLLRHMLERGLRETTRRLSAACASPTP